jgi:hypothetical protein
MYEDDSKILRVILQLKKKNIDIHFFFTFLIDNTVLQFMSSPIHQIAHIL